MKSSIQIAIPKPCPEKWNSFPKTSNGGFCSSCQKEVIDFTSWSDERLKLYFKNLKGNICGRFRQEQLKVYSYDSTNRTSISWISVVFAGFLLLFSPRQVSAQTAFKQPTEQYQPEETKEYIQKATPTVTIIGSVKAKEDGHAMPGVKVMLKGTANETLTDADGKFTLNLPSKNSSQFIVFSFGGFKTVEYLHNVTRPGREIAVDMMRGDVVNVQNSLVGVLGGAVVSRRCESTEIARDIWWWLMGK